MSRATSLFLGIGVCLVAMIIGEATGYQFTAGWIAGGIAGPIIWNAWGYA